MESKTACDPVVGEPAMTEQPPPSASDEALNLAIRIRRRYHAPGNEHVLELNDAALEIDRFAERVCEQRVSAETERCVQIANAARRKYRDMDAFIADEIYQDIRGATVGRAPADRPAPPSPSAVVDYTTPDAPPSSTEKIRECSCHPDDNPPRPCPQKHAYSECVRAAAVVVDYTERARDLAVELVDRALGYTCEFAANQAQHCAQYDYFEGRFRAALSAVASEHQAVLQLAEAKVVQLSETAGEDYSVGFEAGAKALLARLREPEMREAAIAAMIAIDGPQGWTWDEMFDAVLAVITEKLT